MRRHWPLSVGLLLLVLVSVGWVSAAGAKAPAATKPDLASLLKTIREVQPQGKGHRAASESLAKLTAQANADQLPAILAAMDGAGPLAENWLRAAVDTIAERQLKKNGKLPAPALEAFLNQKQHNPRARRLAFEWLARNDASVTDRLIPGMLEDPSLELRRDAVAQLLTAAETALGSDKDAVINKTKVADDAPKPDPTKFEEAKIDPAKRDAVLAIYQKALVSARDLDQVKLITEALKKLGKGVDLPRHYGFLQDWQLVGPFDNRAGKGFNVAYPPEAALDFSANYETPDGKLSWIQHHTDDDYGAVDLNKAIGKHMGVVGYAVAEFNSDAARPVELRLGSENANKIWLNGKLLASAEVYHANAAMDQYTARGELKAGRNVILLKICQDEQTVDWAQNWTFQLRVCDASGKAVLATDRPAPKVADNKTANQQTAATLSKD